MEIPRRELRTKNLIIQIVKCCETDIFCNTTQCTDSTLCTETGIRPAFEFLGGYSAYVARLEARVMELEVAVARSDAGQKMTVEAHEALIKEAIERLEQELSDLDNED